MPPPTSLPEIGHAFFRVTQGSGAARCAVVARPPAEPLLQDWRGTDDLPLVLNLLPEIGHVFFVVTRGRRPFHQWNRCRWIGEVWSVLVTVLTLLPKVGYAFFRAARGPSASGYSAVGRPPAESLPLDRR
ncbi:hypothetical protein [Amycolatopsis sp. cmx-11-12]|uniref:hypothetical protein n=1 Tax=Amycolatopsis sp. cmx-11-12 TaxID=2785795 RepID=UPI003917D979